MNVMDDPQAEIPAVATPGVDDDGQEPDLPLTMAASLVLSALPKTAQAALEGAGELAQTKGLL